MYIYFGIVKKYFSERGFGFLTHPFSLGPKEDIFFHIKNVRRYDEAIADRLANEALIDSICFWYVSETTKKGKQLLRTLESQEVFNLHQENSIVFKDKVMSAWKNIEKPIPFWLGEVTSGLFGLIETDELKSERESSLQKKEEERKEQERLRKIEEEKAKIQREIQRKEQERLRKIEEEKARLEREKRAEEWKRQEEERKRKAAIREQQQKIEDEEFELLVVEMESKGFTKSAQVSHYIIRNRLGDKYQNISGVLEMENGTASWKFNGGFPPDIYARLCRRLNLGNKGTNSKVTGFTSFKALKNK